MILPTDYWNGAHKKYTQKDWITKPTIFATQVIKYFPKGAKILELGCGQGQDTKYLVDQGFSVVASDFSQFALDQIKDSRAEIKILDLNNPLPFKKESFDVVYSHLALHYFDKKRTQELFDEIYDVLKPGGIFATLTNTIEDPEVKDGKFIEPEYFEFETIKKRFFSVDSMRDFTKKFEPIILDAHGETHKDEIKTLIRFVGKKSYTLEANFWDNHSATDYFDAKQKVILDFSKVKIRKS